MTFEELAAQREKTNAVAQFFEQRLRGYLDALRPLLAPRRLLGHRLRGVTEEVPGSDRVLKELKQRFEQVCSKPFNLPAEWDDSPLQGMDSRLELYPWEYVHTAKAGDEPRSITITAPGVWVLAYRSGYSLAGLRAALSGTAQRRQDDVRQFVADTLILNLLLAKFANITQLLGDLRYSVRSATVPDLGQLQLVTIVAPVPSVRPADDLILMATRYSGVAAFIELMDIDALHKIDDPLKQQLEAILA